LSRQAAGRIEPLPGGIKFERKKVRLLIGYKTMISPGFYLNRLHLAGVEERMSRTFRMRREYLADDFILELMVS